MLINEHVAISTSRVLLVPYCQHHVTVYHDWMKDPDIQVATASEPLTMGEEYAMQQSWRTDTDKLTFILCFASPKGSSPPDHTTEIASMIGDVNMFVSVQDADDGKPSLVGELELMIAIKDFQRKGLGRAALLTFLLYILQHEKEIVAQYPGIASVGRDVDSFDYFAVKVNEQNGRSLALFESLGFEKTSSAPSFFGEYEFRHAGFSIESVKELLSKYEIHDYIEVEYKNTIAQPH